jgi:ATP-binding cassette subfamily B protein
MQRKSLPDGEKSKNYSILGELWPLVKPYWYLIAMGLVALAITTTLMLTIPQYFRIAFDSALNGQSVKEFNNVFLLAGATALGLAFFAFIRIVCLEFIGSLALHNFRQKLFAKVLDLHLSFFESRPAGEIISRLTADATVIRMFIRINMPQFVRGIALFFGITLMLFVTNWRLSMLLLIIIPIAMGISWFLGQRMRDLSKKLQDLQADMGAMIEENIYGIRTVHAYNHQHPERFKFSKLQDIALSTGFKWITTYASFISGNVIIGFGAMLLVLWVGGHQVLSGTLTLGELMAYVLYLAFMADAVGTLTHFYPALQTATGATERVFELYNETPQITDKTETKELPKSKSGREITFDNLSFAYPSRPDDNVIKNLDITIKPGETVALVGRSGAGKSTILGLLLRFYEAQSGRILLDGTAIDDIKLEDLRASMALVPQEATIFSTTITENIAYAKPDATAKEVENAAKVAHALEFIQKLPEGFDTEVGEKGVRLSGGQKQRIAIARAVLRNPSILLLDEATSHLDAESERAVQDAFERIQKGRTTLVIAHRLATVQAADRIIVLDEGSISAVGTHKELLKSSPLYQHLAELQFLS